MPDREVIYLGRDNEIIVLLKSNGVAQDLTNVTKIQVTFGSGVTLDSSVSSSLFSGINNSGGTVSFKFGSVTTQLVAGNTYNAEVIVYDASNTDGINWGTIPILVKG